MVKRVREATGKTQLEFAVELGCALSSVQRLEREGLLPTIRAQRARLDVVAKKAGVES